MGQLSLVFVSPPAVFSFRERENPASVEGDLVYENERQLGRGRNPEIPLTGAYLSRSG